MTRTAQSHPSRPQWLQAAILALAMAACSGKESKAPVVNRVAERPTPPAAEPKVVLASAPGGTTEAPPVTRSASYEEAESVYKTGDYSEARKLFESYVESKPENGFGYYMLGLSAWKSGDPAAAELAFERAIEKSPTHLKSLLNSARVLLELGRAHEALERVSAARELDSTGSEALRLQARAEDDLGESDSAIHSYREALVQDEHDVWAMNNLGMLYIRQRDFESALPPLARAVQLRPNAPVFQNNLGIALELAGHFTEARRAYDDALRADSTFAKAISNAKRLGEVRLDPAKDVPVEVKELAEQFRQAIRGWRDSLP
jgi:tetratricopeptide (TPR) repeat protein